MPLSYNKLFQKIYLYKIVQKIIELQYLVFNRWKVLLKSSISIIEHFNIFENMLYSLLLFHQVSIEIFVTYMKNSQ